MRIAVVGAGVVGMATTAVLLRAGADVTCYDRFADVMGERSAGSSRIFRLAHADADLVRLAVRAREGFAVWAQRAGRPMLHPHGCVVSGGDAADRAAAMAAAGVPHALVGPDDPGLRLPGAVTDGPVLVDPGGGVVDVDAVRALLVAEAGNVAVPLQVRRVEADGDGATVRSDAGANRYDAVVLAAGAGTAVLARQAGIALPAALVHHARFTFPFPERAGRPPWASWIDTPRDGLATYQHRAGPGRWAVGGSVDPALVAWDAGREAAVAASREVVLAHVRARLAVRPEVVGTLYCTHAPDTGDGIAVHRAGPVVAVHGENLMKFAPVLGEDLAAAVLHGTTPRYPLTARPVTDRPAAHQPAGPSAPHGGRGERRGFG